MLSKLIKGVCAYKEVNMKELAERIGKSPQNLHGILVRDDLRESELKAIAKALDCELIIALKDNETGKMYDWYDANEERPKAKPTNKARV